MRKYLLAFAFLLSLPLHAVIDETLTQIPLNGGCRLFGKPEHFRVICPKRIVLIKYGALETNSSFSIKNMLSNGFSHTGDLVKYDMSIDGHVDLVMGDYVLPFQIILSDSTAVYVFPDH